MASPWLQVIGSFFFFSSRRRHTRWPRDWSQTCALPISPQHRTGRRPPLVRDETSPYHGSLALLFFISVEERYPRVFSWNGNPEAPLRRRSSHGRGQQRHGSRLRIGVARKLE